MRIGILGFGRFGAALGELVLERGLPLMAWDPAGTVPVTFRAQESEELAARAHALVLAVRKLGRLMP